MKNFIKKNKKPDVFYLLCAVIFFVYLISIFVVNLIGREWVNYDMHSDAILSKYIAESHYLFPDKWIFGNQIYTVATPAVASLFYTFLGDSYLALAVSSCVMTLLSILCFVWCLRPFAKNKSIIVCLLVFIGGTNIGKSAHGDTSGLQVFYTMASYYACYIIGIFLTLGVFVRIINKIPVNRILQISVLILNFALGMQSLREMLVLNLPLFAVALLSIFFLKKSGEITYQQNKKSCFYAIYALLSNAFGFLFSKFLIWKGIIRQEDILGSVSSDLRVNIVNSIKMFLKYIGIVKPDGIFGLFKLACAIFSVIIVLLATISIINEYIQNRKTFALGIMIVFFVIGLIAVFFSGVFVINLRPIYFFCWYPLVTCCVAYLMDTKWQKRQSWSAKLKTLLIFALVCISVINYRYTFVNSFKSYSNKNSCLYDITTQLKEDGIKYLYSDWRTELNVLSVVSNDEILYGTLKFSDHPDDLWHSINYLCSDLWFDPENFDKAYIVLSDSSIKALETEFSEEYQKEFMSNLLLIHKFKNNDGYIYFYKGSQKMFKDMIN